MSAAGVEPVVPEQVPARAMGRHLDRQDGVAKVTGAATYAVEHPVPGDVLHAWLVTSTTPRGRVLRVDASDALAHPGVVRVLDHTNAPRLADTEDRELAVLQDDRIGFRGQIVALVVAASSEAAREAAGLVRVHQEEEPAAVVYDEDSAFYAPEEVNAGHETDAQVGDPDPVLAAAPVGVDATYDTPTSSTAPWSPTPRPRSGTGSC
ncbi:hypothetical protein [Nocardioides zeae]